MKVYEAIGQSLYYASQTNKKPGIILLIRKNNSEKHIRKVKEVINFFKLDINLIIKDLISKNKKKEKSSRGDMCPFSISSSVC